MIQRAINNILSNALRYAVSHIEISYTNQKLTISNHGPAISKEDLPYIFDRLYRSDKSRTSQIKGSGLGLSIVKQIVEQHRGSVHAESTLNKGTRIIIILPEA